MSKFHLKFQCVILVILCTVMLMSSCGAEKYKFIDDGVLQSPDGTLYYRYEKMVYTFSTIQVGEFLGEVKGYHGTGHRGLKKGVYSLNSDGSDDYIVFVEEKEGETYKSGEPQRSLLPIYVKEGCELNYRDWDKVSTVSLTINSDYVQDYYDTSANNDAERPHTLHYNLNEGNIASDVMNKLIGDVFTENEHESGTGQCRIDIQYQIDGLDLVDIDCVMEHWSESGWMIYAPDAMKYHVDPEAFAMFDMPERMVNYLQYPIRTDKD